jgi:hypothetical protein
LRPAVPEKYTRYSCANHFAVCYHDRQKKADLPLFVGFVSSGMPLKLRLVVPWWSLGAQDARRR